MSIEEYRDESGNIRMLARTEPNDDHRKMRAAMPSFTDWIRSTGGDLIPRNQLVDVDRRDVLGVEFINNQQSSSGCTAWQAAQLAKRSLRLRGHKVEELSGAFLYAHINGGRDAGSVITDAMKSLQNVGICLRSEMDLPKMFMRDVTPSMVQSAARHKVGMCVTLYTFDEILTAVSMGFVCEFPICVGSNFERFSSDGVAGFTPGGGNHAVGADGIKLINGQWHLDMPNTWSANFGPWKNGRCYLSERAVEGAGYPQDGYAIIDVVYDPMDPNLPPAPVN